MYSNVFIIKCDLELFWNGSVHEFYRLKELLGNFGASEHFMSVVEKKRLSDQKRLVACCKLFLYANESCYEPAVYFWRSLN